MNLPLQRSLLLAALASAVTCSGFAQTAAPTTTTPPGGVATNATTAPKPLGTPDRKFIKDAGEQILAVRRLTEITRHQGPGSEEVKKLNAQILADYDKIWGELGTVAGARKVDLPNAEASSNDKQTVAKIRKTDEKNFDKTLLKALEKETKKTAQVFEQADKSVQDPDLKTVLSNWTPKVKSYAEEVTTAEAAASKRK
jgi:predicted outer membrane protein